MAYVGVDALRQELRALERKVDKANVLLLSLIPEEKATPAQLRELKRISREMAAGKKHSFKEVFG